MRSSATRTPAAGHRRRARSRWRCPPPPRPADASASGGSRREAARSADTIVGAGASFPYPLYSKWARSTRTRGARLNYQSIGSGGGISAIKAGTVNFGASDAPLEESELSDSSLVQFPMCVGGVVPVVNTDGVADGELEAHRRPARRDLQRDITTWSDPAIVARTAACKLPDPKINVVHRSDSSGTTWIFTHYLEAAAPGVWKVGADKEVPWPTGVGGKGNEGVAASVQQLSGSIGYVEYAYAKQAQMVTVQMQNKDGEFVAPSIAAFEAAASQADWKASLPSMYLILVDQARQGHVAHRRRLVHPRAGRPAGRGPREVDAELLRLGLHERRLDGQEPRLRADPAERLRPRRERRVDERHGQRRARLEMTPTDS